MAEPFLSEIRIFSFGFPPKGWALCNGQLLQINQNQALFSLLGTTYGGDGRVNFGLPNLQGRAPIHMGNHTLGEQGGEQAHTLTSSELPAHVHAVHANSAAVTQTTPANNSWGSEANGYSSVSPDTALQGGSLSSSGGSQAHLNMQPYLTLNFSIALQGIFPSQT